MDTEEKSVIIGVILVVVLVGSLFVLNITGFYQDYSEGQRTGDIFKFSKKGLIWKSWEGTMYLGGYHSTGGKTPTIETDKFHFSIPVSEEKQEVIDKLNECSEKRLSCTIQYQQWFISPIQVSTDYIVQDVKINN